MSDPRTLFELARRCRREEGPSRDFDAMIGAAVRWLPANAKDWLRRWTGPFHPKLSMPGRIETHSGMHWEVPPFTASLDAALLLLPERVDWHVQHNPSVGYAWASVTGPNGVHQPWSAGVFKALTPAIAICAAALRVRAGMLANGLEPEEEDEAHG